MRPGCAATEASGQRCHSLWHQNLSIKGSHEPVLADHSTQSLHAQTRPWPVYMHAAGPSAGCWSELACKAFYHQGA